MIRVFSLVMLIIACCVGCGDTSVTNVPVLPLHPNTTYVQNVHQKMYRPQSTTKNPDDPTYILLEQKHVVCFTSTPRAFDSNLKTGENEQSFAADFVNLLIVVNQWIDDHPERQVLSWSTLERGGYYATHDKENAYYTARVILLLK